MQLNQSFKKQNMKKRNLSAAKRIHKFYLDKLKNPKIKKVYLCSACGDDFPKWNGQCPSCNEWGTLSEFATSKNKVALTNDEIVQGLKEALNVGIKKVGVKASQVGGFNKNEMIRIPFPEEAKKWRKN